MRAVRVLQGRPDTAYLGIPDVECEGAGKHVSGGLKQDCRGAGYYDPWRERNGDTHHLALIRGIIFV
ncbi:Uncharacterized protein pbN1_10140 [Aromatoleum bremense]|nr:Uncharacterized protein pbN1_10140 [Aromatoleum bremense]